MEIVGASGNFTYRASSADGETGPRRRLRRLWSAVAVNKAIASMDRVLGDAKQQGFAGRNVAELVNRVAVPHKDVDTYAEAEGWAKDRIRELQELRKSAGLDVSDRIKVVMSVPLQRTTGRAPTRT